MDHTHITRFCSEADKKLIDAYRRTGFADGDELLFFIESFFELDGKSLHIPRAQVCPEHTPPAEYITAAFFETYPDTICWANRGGGKTLSGALATWLDSIFKAGCETKILGGSLEQSQRMYDHIKQNFIDPPEFDYLAANDSLKARTRLPNGSSIQILTASMKSVRGPHPQKLKLDEIDEFDDRIYEAALMIPMDKANIGASRHIYSTMHKSYGLMQRIVEEAPTTGYKIFKWCILDVLERCEGRECPICDLWPECQGRARGADGFYSIENAITLKRLVSEQTWQTEALCLMPSQEGLIYKDFSMDIHVI